MGAFPEAGEAELPTDSPTSLALGVTDEMPLAGSSQHSLVPTLLDNTKTVRIVSR